MGRALVTGGAGCIGSDLAQALLERGDEVVVLDNLSSGRREHIQPLLALDGFHWIEGDVLDENVVDAAMRDVDIVYHLAANPDVKFREGEPTDKDLRQNTLGTYTVLEAARRHGVSKFAFASTSAVYGIAQTQPIPEDHPTRPISLYGASKLACEGFIHAFQHLFDMQCWIFRFANIVGPKVRSRGQTVISDFIRKLSENPRHLEILGNGRQAKSYLLNRECVDAMLFAVDNAPESMNVYNLGCDDYLEVNRIAEMVCQAMKLADVQFSYTGTEGGWPGDVPRFVLDVSRINALGWTAQHASEEAVALTIQALVHRYAVA